MTRAQIREIIADTICKYYKPGSDVVFDIQQASEEITQLFDQGFAYELKTDPDGSVKLIDNRTLKENGNGE